MIDLAVFSGRDLKNAKTLFSLFGNDVNAILQAIEFEITSRAPKEPAPCPAPDCSGCGGGTLLPLATIDGVRRIGCVCGYSEVVE